MSISPWQRAGMDTLEWRHTGLKICCFLAARYGFRSPPHLELKARPKLGEREVTLVHITDWIEKKLEQEFQVWSQLNRFSVMWGISSATVLNCWEISNILISSGHAALCLEVINEIRFGMAEDLLQGSHFMAFPQFPIYIAGQHLQAHLQTAVCLSGGPHTCTYLPQGDERKLLSTTPCQE